MAAVIAFAKQPRPSGCRRRHREPRAARACCSSSGVRTSRAICSRGPGPSSEVPDLVGSAPLGHRATSRTGRPRLRQRALGSAPSPNSQISVESGPGAPMRFVGLPSPLACGPEREGHDGGKKTRRHPSKSGSGDPDVQARRRCARDAANAARRPAGIRRLSASSPPSPSPTRPRPTRRTLTRCADPTVRPSRASRCPRAEPPLRRRRPCRRPSRKATRSFPPARVGVAPHSRIELDEAPCWPQQAAVRELWPRAEKRRRTPVRARDAPESRRAQLSKLLGRSWMSSTRRASHEARRGPPDARGRHDEPAADEADVDEVPVDEAPVDEVDEVAELARSTTW